MTGIRSAGTLAAAVSIWALSPGAAYAQPDGPRDEKLADDPTKVITKLGLRYTDEAGVFGSVAFGPVSKINLSLAESGEWRIGGSYLFSFGIVNVAASRKDLNTGVSQTQYSIGSFLPLGVFGFSPGGWQIFAAFGANHVEGTPTETPARFGDGMPLTVTSKGGYLGAMALRPLSEDWTFKSGAVLSRGSNDFSGYSLGAGLTYALTPRLNLSGHASWTDNSLGQRDQLGISLIREF